MKIFISIIFLFQFIPGIFSQEKCGLFFHSSAEPQDQRTSLNLSKYKALTFNDRITIEFEISLLKQRSFGYIFRLIDVNKQSVDLVYYPNHTKDSLCFRLINSGNFSPIVFFLPEKEYSKKIWNKVIVVLDAKRKRIDMTFHNKTLTDFSLELDCQHGLEFVFGSNPNGRIVSIDVSSFILRELKIRNSVNKAIHYWPLNNYEGNVVADQVGDRDAFAINPVWEIRKHHHWEKLASFKTGQYTGITFNTDDQSIINTCRDGMIQFHVDKVKMNKITYLNDPPEFENGHLSYYNSLSRNIISYDSIGENVALLDMDTKKWEVLHDKISIHGIYHHNTFFDHRGKMVIAFGYDGLKYFNDLNILDFSGNKRAVYNYKIRKFHPRYWAGIGKLNDTGTYIVFGGVGNQKGMQELGTQHFYDLHLLDVNTNMLKKIWEMKDIKKDFVPAKNILYCPGDSVFYALCFSDYQYKSWLRLYKFSLTHPSYQIVSDSIPFLFDDKESETNLFFNHRSNEFIAYTKHVEKDSARVTIYSLDYPPIFIEKGSKSVNVPSLKVILTSMTLLILITTFILLRKIYWPSRWSSVMNKGLHLPKEIHSPFPEDDKIAENAIHLFGTLKIVDRNGINLAPGLTPKIEELFLLIFFYSEYNEGIETKELTHILWGHLDASSAKNSRNVSISNLRKVLSFFQGVEIHYVKNKYKIIISQHVYFDYRRLLSLADEMRNENFNLLIINEFSEILLKGSLLCFHTYDWMDSFKEKVLNMVLDIFDMVMANQILHNQFAALMKLSESILTIDNYNEEAFLLKMHACKNTGKKNRAKAFYDQFVKEYIKTYNINFAYNFEECWNMNYDEIIYNYF